MAEHQEPSKSEGKRRILLAEDDLAFCRLMKVSIEAQGFDVDTANDGAVALEMLQANQYDLLITDHQMPRMTGIDLLKHLKVAQPELPVIVVTGEGSESIAVQALRLGATDYIQKGNGAEFIAVVPEHIRRAFEHKELVQAKKKSEEHIHMLTLAIQYTGDSVIITDRDGVIHFVNPAFELLTGYSSQEAIGQNPRIIKSGQHDPEFYQGMWKSLAGGQEFRGEFHNKRKNGELFYELKTVSPICNEDGAIEYIVSIGRDITVTKRMEEAILQAKAQEAELAMLHKTAATYTHEISSPLTGLLADIQLLIERGPPTETNEILTEMEGAGRQIMDVIHKLKRMTEPRYKPYIGGREILDIEAVE